MGNCTGYCTGQGFTDDKPKMSVKEIVDVNNNEFEKEYGQGDNIYPGNQHLGRNLKNANNPGTEF